MTLPNDDLKSTDFRIPPEGIALYIHRRSNDLDKLKLAFEAKDTCVFQKIGHSIKGNAVNFGFPELELIGKKLELVSKLNDWDLAKELIAEFEHWYLQKKSNSIALF